VEFIRQEQISQLQISVDHFLVMNVFQSLNDLVDEVLGFKLSDSLSPFQQIA
jgi:hypothetical protein